MGKLIFGVGINDAGYYVIKFINGKQVMCPFYRKWASMMARCYYTKYQSRMKSYIGCSVIDEWKVFSNFRKWMETQDWRGKQLDKDLLVMGNKIYSPETCLFIDPHINYFLTDSASSRGDFPIGVSYLKKTKKFSARCRNPIGNKMDNLGYFSNPEDAHLAWKRRKHELACQLAELQEDDRVANALRNRYK